MKLIKSNPETGEITVSMDVSELCLLAAVGLKALPVGAMPNTDEKFSNVITSMSLGPKYNYKALPEV